MNNQPDSVSVKKRHRSRFIPPLNFIFSHNLSPFLIRLMLPLRNTNDHHPKENRMLSRLRLPVVARIFERHQEVITQRIDSSHWPFSDQHSASRQCELSRPRMVMACIETNPLVCGALIINLLLCLLVEPLLQATPQHRQVLVDRKTQILASVIGMDKHVMSFIVTGKRKDRRASVGFVGIYCSNKR